MPKQVPPRRTGLRREATIFLPTATLALMVLSVLAMLSYRSSLVSLTANARSTALLEVRRAASDLPEDASTSGALRRAFGRDADAQLVSAEGITVAAIGRPSEVAPFGPLGTRPREATTAGPTAATAHRLIVWLPLRNGLTLRVAQPATTLAEQWQRWRRLMIVVTSAVGALATLLLLYLRRLFKPIDSLLRTARQLDDEAPAEGDDEIEFLVHRFENAMAVLQNQRQYAAATSGELPFDEEIETLERTFSHLESGMALIDMNGTVLALNDVGSRTLELAHPELPCPVATLLHEHDDLADLVGSAIAAQTPLRRKECTIGLNGTVRELGLTLSPLSRQDDTQRGWIMLFADLTDANQEAQQKQISTSLDQLAALSAGLAHELRNSLASMQGYAALIQRAELPSATAADTLELQREIDQLHRIVEDFLSFARPPEAESRPVDLLRLCHRVAGDPALAGAPVKVRASEELPHPESWTVEGDELLLHRLLRNLLLNAVRAQTQAKNGETPTPAPVTVTLSRQQSSTLTTTTIAVDDRGPGLSPAIRERLFVPFATDSEDGSGLGLAVARRIAELHSAELAVRDRQPGPGVTASVTFESAIASPSTTEPEG